MGGGGSSTSNQSSSLTPNSAMMPMLGYGGALGQSIMDQPTGYFPGQGYVGPSGLTQEGVDLASQAGRTMAGTAGGYDTAGNMMQNAAQYGYGAVPGLNQVGQTGLQNYNFLSNAADVANNPYVQNQLAANQRIAMGSLGQAMPMVNQGAQGVNALGSSRHGMMQGKAIGDTMGGLMNTNASTMLNAYGQGLGAQQNALSQIGNVQQGLQGSTDWMGKLGQMYGAGADMQGKGANALAQGAGMLGQAGQTVEDYQGRALQDSMNRYNFQFQEPWQRLQNINQVTNAYQPYGVQQGTGQSSQQASRGSQVASGIGTAATVAGIAMMMSDRRLKRNIRQIGKTGAGFNIYAWDYVWGAPGVGVMADEVPAEWVHRMPSGFDAVDYSMVK
jgi:hypothetical protein